MTLNDFYHGCEDSLLFVLSGSRLLFFGHLVIRVWLSFSALVKKCVTVHVLSECEKNRGLVICDSQLYFRRLLCCVEASETEIMKWEDT